MKRVAFYTTHPPSIHLDIRWGLAAPKFFIRCGSMTLMWWGWKNGKLEVLWRKSVEEK